VNDDGRLRKDLWHLRRNTLDTLARRLENLLDHFLGKLVKKKKMQFIKVFQFCLFH